MMNTEAFSNGWTRSCYETNTEQGYFYPMDPENGNKNIRKWSGDSAFKAENMWKMYHARPYLSGYFVWTAFDYKGEPTPMPYPAVSTQYGVMDYCGFKKDIAYYYQSWWSGQPVLHVFPHWNLAGQEAVSYTHLDVYKRQLLGKSGQGNGMLRFTHAYGTIGALVNINIPQKTASFSQFILTDAAGKPAAQYILTEENLLVFPVQVHIFYCIFNCLRQLLHLNRLEKIIIHAQPELSLIHI